MKSEGGPIGMSEMYRSPDDESAGARVFGALSHDASVVANNAIVDAEIHVTSEAIANDMRSALWGSGLFKVEADGDQDNPSARVTYKGGSMPTYVFRIRFDNAKQLYELQQGVKKSDATYDFNPLRDPSKNIHNLCERISTFMMAKNETHSSEGGLSDDEIAHAAGVEAVMRINIKALEEAGWSPEDIRAYRIVAGKQYLMSNAKKRGILKQLFSTGKAFTITDADAAVLKRGQDVIEAYNKKVNTEFDEKVYEKDGREAIANAISKKFSFFDWEGCLREDARWNEAKIRQFVILAGKYVNRKLTTDEEKEFLKEKKVLDDIVDRYIIEGGERLFEEEYGVDSSVAARKGVSEKKWRKAMEQRWLGTHSTTARLTGKISYAHEYGLVVSAMEEMGVVKEGRKHFEKLIAPIPIGDFVADDSGTPFKQTEFDCAMKVFARAGSTLEHPQYTKTGFNENTADDNRNKKSEEKAAVGKVMVRLAELRDARRKEKMIEEGRKTYSADELTEINRRRALNADDPEHLPDDVYALAMQYEGAKRLGILPTKTSHGAWQKVEGMLDEVRRRREVEATTSHEKNQVLRMKGLQLLDIKQRNAIARSLTSADPNSLQQFEYQRYLEIIGEAGLGVTSVVSTEDSKILLKVRGIIN